MGHTIAVMITKGGVGKSTLVMALAETLSVHFGKRVLVVDSDSQSSVSAMLMAPGRLREHQGQGRSIAELLSAAALSGDNPDWRAFVVDGASDVDDAGSVSLLPGNINLALFEREVAGGMRFAQLNAAVTNLIREFNAAYDVTLVDCPPALTFLTEAWMRQADFHLSPTRPDTLGLHGLDVLERFEALNADNSFSRRLGVVVNMIDTRSPVDRGFHDALMARRSYRCFAQAIPAHASVRHAALYQPEQRSYMAKYPGIGTCLQGLAGEMLARIEEPATPERATDPARAPAVSQAE